MHKTHKRWMLVGLGIVGMVSLVTPICLGLVACSGEQETTSSITQPVQPNHPSQPSTPVVANSNIKFSSHDLQTIYQTVQGVLNSYSSSTRLAKLTNTNLNASTNQKSVMQKLTSKLNKGSLSKAVQSIDFHVNRYLDSIEFNIHFFPRAIPTNLFPTSHKTNSNQSVLNNMSYGNQGQDKNSLVMTYPNMGISKYLCNDDLVIWNDAVLAYANKLAQQSITNMNQITLNQTLDTVLYPTLQELGFNTNVIQHDTTMFGYYNPKDNAITYFGAIRKDFDVVFDPNCVQITPTWDFYAPYYKMNITWKGDLSHLFGISRLNFMGVSIDHAITNLAPSVNCDANQLATKLSAPSFSAQMWTKLMHDTGFAFVTKLSTSQLPLISFTNIETGQDSWENPGFYYRYSYTLPKGTPISKQLYQVPYIQKNFQIVTNKDKSITISTITSCFSRFVPDDDI